MNFGNGINVKLSTLKEFVHDAKMASFAGSEDKTVLPDNTSLYSFRKFKGFPQFAGLIYTDRYNGNIVEGGQETVSSDLVPVWRNQYYGGARAFFRQNETQLSKLVSEEDRIGNIITAFLKQALLSIPKDFPVRGPREFKAEISEYKDDSVKGDWQYSNDWKQIPLFDTNDPFAAFLGEEKISFNGKDVYWHGYQGGLLFDKYFPTHREKDESERGK